MLQTILLYIYIYSRGRLVVCLEESLYIHNIRDMKVLHTIRDTPPNPTGLCALSSNSENCYLAYPGSATAGEVQIFDAMNLVCVSVVLSLLYKYITKNCICKPPSYNTLI